MWNKIFKAMRNACINFLSLYIVVIIYANIFGRTLYNFESFIVFVVGLTIGDLLVNWLFNDTSKIIEFIKKS